jgi:hypothetical protein
VLRNAGFATIGPADDVQQASDLIASEKVDAGILDIDFVRQAIHDVL